MKVRKSPGSISLLSDLLSFGYVLVQYTQGPRIFGWKRFTFYVISSSPTTDIPNRKKHAIVQQTTWITDSVDTCISVHSIDLYIYYRVVGQGVNWVLSEQWVGENLEGFHLSSMLLMASL